MYKSGKALRITQQEAENRLQAHARVPNAFGPPLFMLAAHSDNARAVFAHNLHELVHAVHILVRQMIQQ